MQPMCPEDAEVAQATPRSGRARLAFVAAVLLLVAVHAGLVSYFDHPSIIFDERPLSGADFDTHIEQTWRVLEGLDGWGKTWVYDVQLLAGHPNGTIFDADNKAWELWTFLLWKLGLPRGTAFNTFLLLAHVLVLPVVYASARLFGLGRWAALGAAGLGSMLWFFDGFAHWCWWVGMVAYAMASVLFLLPLALFFRYLQEWRWWQGVLVAALMGVGHLVHPYTFVIMVVPMLALYIRAWRGLTARRHLAVWGIALGVIAFNAYWLAVALSFWDQILYSGYFGQTSLKFLLADFFEVLLDPSATGIIGSRSGFRFLALGGAVVMLVVWRQRKDPRFLPLAAGIVVMLVLTYLGGYVGIIGQIQPYRHVFPAAFLAIIPAAALGEELWRTGVLKRLPKIVYAVGAVLLLPGLQLLGRDVIYFFPDSLPKVAPLLDGTPPLISASGYPEHMRYRHYPMDETLDELSNWVAENDDGQSRFLVQAGVVGEQLAWKTRAQVLGGFQHRNLEHAYSNLFRIYPQGILPPDELRRYLETYAVRWVIVTLHRPWFDAVPDLLELHVVVGIHRIYRTKVDVDLFLQGSGETQARTNQIAVSNTHPDEDIVLRYHWLDTLVCAPDCTIEPYDNPLRGVPFIRVPAPHPADFEIRNDY
jgi:hypothetical protein